MGVPHGFNLDLKTRALQEWHATKASERCAIEHSKSKITIEVATRSSTCKLASVRQQNDELGDHQGAGDEKKACASGGVVDNARAAGSMANLLQRTVVAPFHIAGYDAADAMTRFQPHLCSKQLGGPPTHTQKREVAARARTIWSRGKLSVYPPSTSKSRPLELRSKLKPIVRIEMKKA